MKSYIDLQFASASAWAAQVNGIAHDLFVWYSYRGLISPFAFCVSLVYQASVQRTGHKNLRFSLSPNEQCTYRFISFTFANDSICVALCFLWRASYIHFWLLWTCTHGALNSCVVVVVLTILIPLHHQLYRQKTSPHHKLFAIINKTNWSSLSHSLMQWDNAVLLLFFVDDAMFLSKLTSSQLSNFRMWQNCSHRLTFLLRSSNARSPYPNC